MNPADILQHIKNIGENLAAGFRDARGACLGWSEEEQKYTPGEWNSDVGHFTQMVWKSTTSVGCGWELCDNLLQDNTRQALFVCHYYEQGNVVDSDGKKLRENVGNKTEASNVFHEMLPDSDCSANSTSSVVKDGQSSGKDALVVTGVAATVHVNYGLVIMATTLLLGSLGFMPLVGVNF